ncbi:unnamed protein product, partial [Pleuronectes platessa]
MLPVDTNSRASIYPSIRPSIHPSLLPSIHPSVHFLHLLILCRVTEAWRSIFPAGTWGEATLNHDQGWTGHLAYRASSRWAVDPMWAGLSWADSAVNHNTNQGGAGPHSILGGESRDGLLLRQKLKMDNKSKKRPGGAEKHREKKPKSLEVEAATCAKLTDLFGAGFTSPAAAGAPGDERGGLDNDERVEADM